MLKFQFAVTASCGIACYIYSFKRHFKVSATSLQQQTSKWDHNWDLRQKENEVSKSVRHIVLVRHGQFHMYRPEGKERCLSDIGRQQSALCGERLKHLDVPWEVMVYSPLMRAKETGEIIAEHLKPIKIQECQFLEEGIPVMPEPAMEWKIEQSKIFRDESRFEAAFRKYFYRADPAQSEDSFTLLVCHSNLIRYLVCRVLQFPTDAWYRMTLNNASITWISIMPDGRVFLKYYGESGHLPAVLVTER